MHGEQLQGKELLSLPQLPEQFSLSHLPAAVHSLEDISVSQPHKERVRVESRARIYVCPDGPGFHNIHWDWVVCVPPLGSKLDSIF